MKHWESSRSTLAFPQTMPYLYTSGHRDIGAFGHHSLMDYFGEPFESMVIQRQCNEVHLNHGCYGPVET